MTFLEIKSQITPERREKMKKKIESTRALIADRELDFIYFIVNT